MVVLIALSARPDFNHHIHVVVLSHMVRLLLAFRVKMEKRFPRCAIKDSVKNARLAQVDRESLHVAQNIPIQYVEVLVGVTKLFC